MVVLQVDEGIESVLLSNFLTHTDNRLPDYRSTVNQPKAFQDGKIKIALRFETKEFPGFELYDLKTLKTGLNVIPLVLTTKY